MSKETAKTNQKRLQIKKRQQKKSTLRHDIDVKRDSKNESRKRPKKRDLTKTPLSSFASHSTRQICGTYVAFVGLF